MLEFAKIFIPLGEAVKIDIDALDVKFAELDRLIKNLEKDLEETKNYLQSLTESEDEFINGVSKLEIIQSCTQFYFTFAQFHTESGDMFKEVENDFK